MTDERRQGDLLIMDKLSVMHTDLALNTQETKRTTEQLTKLNGKVLAHESRLQTMEANQALISSNLAEAKTKKSEWTDWLLKGIVVVALALFYYLLTHNGFPNFLN
jgi:RNase H-fold protein (predicted Holliday junction resolvase)